MRSLSFQEIKSHRPRVSGKQGFKYSSQSPFFLFPLQHTPLWGGDCRPARGMQPGEERFRASPVPPACSVSQQAPSQLLLALKAPSLLVIGNSVPQSPACRPPAPSHVRHGHGRMLLIRQSRWAWQPQALPLVGLISLGVSHFQFLFHNFS